MKTKLYALIGFATVFFAKRVVKRKAAKALGRKSSKS